MTEQTSDPRTIVIFGAGGTTGKHAIRAARNAGFRVRAVDHTLPDTTSDDNLITHIQGDVLKDDLSDHVKGGDVVLSCLGVGNDPATLLDPPPLYTDGTSAICDAMEAQGVKRLIVMSASFVEEKNRGPLWFKIPAMTGLHLVFEQMGQMEAILRKRSGSIDWTAVRPGWLMEGEETRDYTVQADVIPEDMIRSRHADVAHFMVSLAQSGDWVHATPAIARDEPASASAPDKVLNEMLG